MSKSKCCCNPFKMHKKKILASIGDVMVLSQKCLFCVTPMSHWKTVLSQKCYISVYNRLPVLQISMFRSSSQYLVAASGQRRPAKPPGALYAIQSTTTCCTDCVICPQAHVADSCAPQSFNVSPTRAVPHRRRFSFTHCLRGRSAPGGSTGLG